MMESDAKPGSSLNDDQNEDPDYDTSDEGLDIDPFAPILDAINLEALASAATSVRLKQHCRNLSSLAKRREELTCIIQEPPLIGSFNLAFVILFSDGVKWIARIPGSGVDSFGHLEARKLLSDIQTSALIRSSTSIPIPEVFAWELSRENPVGVPYHMEGFIEGIPLSDRWTDLAEPERVKLLRDLAGLMSQLHVLHFDKIGSLVFGVSGKFSNVDEMVQMKSDIKAMFDGDEVWPTASTCGPFTSTKTYLLAKLNFEYSEMQEWRKAELSLLRLAVNSIPPAFDTPKNFSLGHPDFNYQNILVNDDGIITGLIDWDGIHTLPAALGFARYPSWITRDWDPAKYGYSESDCRDEDSPEQLVSYRREYAKAMEALSLAEGGYETNDTRLSQILEAVDIAVDNSVSRSWILQKLLKSAFEDKVPFTFPEYRETWLANQAEEWMDAVRDAFVRMWHEEV